MLREREGGGGVLEVRMHFGVGLCIAHSRLLPCVESAGRGHGHVVLTRGRMPSLCVFTCAVVGSCSILQFARVFVEMRRSCNLKFVFLENETF